ncbi:MAG: hypothetical protein IT336_06650, partial [Thermomicrobiales bacterium]|nr:hypothetical protein [Thermomicrobiales bacterium]
MTARASTAAPSLLEGRGPVAAADALRIELISSRTEIARLWQEVEQTVGVDALTATWAWTETWLEHFGDLVPHRFAVAFAP